MENLTPMSLIKSGNWRETNLIHPIQDFFIRIHETRIWHSLTIENLTMNYCQPYQFKLLQHKAENFITIGILIVKI